MTHIGMEIPTFVYAATGILGLMVIPDKVRYRFRDGAREESELRPCPSTGRFLRVFLLVGVAALIAISQLRADVVMVTQASGSGTVSGTPSTLASGSAETSGVPSVISPDIPIDGTYAVQLEVCVDGLCPGQSGTAQNPFRLRLTDATITCLQSTLCDSIDVIAFSDLTSIPTGTLGLELDLTGNATGFTSGLVGFAVCDYQATNFSACQAPIQADFLSTGGSFGGSANGTVQIAGPVTIGMDFHLDLLTAGASVNLPSSADLTFTAIEEPRFVAFAGAGMIGVGLFVSIRRRNGQSSGDQ